MTNQTESASKRPARLYKYMSLSGEGLERAEAIITQGRMFFASPSDFNDPFEARFRFWFQGGREQWRTLMRDVGRIGSQVLPRTITDEQVDRFAVSTSSDSRSVDSDIRQQLERECAMCCLSSRPDDLLMWAHYADCHRGICIEVNAEPDGSFFAGAEKVEYATEFPALNYFDTTLDDRGRAVFLTKAACWSYEEEWRIIDVTAPRGLRTFNTELITGIIFGSRCSQETIQTVRGWCASATHAIQLAQAKIREGAYSLDIEGVT